MENKRLYQSSTLWFNILMLVVEGLQSLASQRLIPQESVACIIALGNVILRIWRTKLPIGK